MGIVYKARDPHIERSVAIKTIRKDLLDADLAAQFMARFRNEARAAGRLHHPNIVGIYEYGEADEVAYIAMEYVDGTGLREYLNRKARFEFQQILAILTQLLAGARIRACAGRRAPRHQAGEPDPDVVGRAQGRRLRHRARRRIEPDDDGHGDGHPVVHGARAVPGAAERSSR